MNRDERSDERLMRAVATGQREALDTLLRRYASSLLTFIHRMVADRHRAEELFQEVFLSVWTSRCTYTYPRPFRPWLFAIALNRCRADFRKPIPLPVVIDDDCPQPVVATGPSPVETVVAVETASLVATAVARLAPTRRTVVVLRIWNGLSYAEIGKILRCSEGTARSHMFHGLAALRKYLEPRLK